MSTRECEDCDATVRWREVEREELKYKNQSIVLERVVIGVCDGCGLRYYSAATLHAVRAAAIQSSNC